METQKQPAENSVRLKLTGFAATPEEVTALLGLKPTNTGQKGQPYQMGTKLITNRKWEHNLWELNSTADPAEPLETHLAQLLQTLQPKQAALAQVLQSGQGELLLVSYLEDVRNPNFRISREQLAQIVALGMSVEVDIYLLEELEQPAE
jgi:hypothetical protein